MRKKSKNKCYPDDIAKLESSKTYTPTFPKTSQDIKFVRETTVNKLDQFSGVTTTTLGFKYFTETNGEGDAFYATVTSDSLMNTMIDEMKSIFSGIKTQSMYDQSYKYNYKLLTMYISKEINSIKLYCKGLAASGDVPFDHPMHGRYIIVVSGYMDNKCIIDYEVITYHNYTIHPSRILSDISSAIEKQGLDNVEIDKESFDTAIKDLGENNPLNRERFTQEDLLRQLEILDKMSK